MHYHGKMWLFKCQLLKLILFCSFKFSYPECLALHGVFYFENTVIQISLPFLCMTPCSSCVCSGQLDVAYVVSPPFLVAQRNMLWWWTSKNCLEFVWSVPTAVTEPENSAAAPGIILRYALSILLDTYRAFFFFFWTLNIFSNEISDKEFIHLSIHFLTRILVHGTQAAAQAEKPSPHSAQPLLLSREDAEVFQASWEIKSLQHILGLPRGSLGHSQQTSHRRFLGDTLVRCWTTSTDPFCVIQTSSSTRSTLCFSRITKFLISKAEPFRESQFPEPTKPHHLQREEI